MTFSGSVSNHLWCSRYKDSIHLLTALCSRCGTDNYLTVPGQQGLCRPLLLLCQWHKCAFQLLVHPETLNARRPVCIWEWVRTMIVCFHSWNQYFNRKKFVFDNLMILKAWDISLRANQNNGFCIWILGSERLCKCVMMWKERRAGWGW